MQSAHCRKTTHVTAAEAEANPTQFSDVICDEIGRFRKWSVGVKDVTGSLHAVYTKTPYVFATETAACRPEMERLIRHGVLSRFDGKPRHVIPWFSVAKRDSAERRIVLDFRGLNKLTHRSPALPMHKEGMVQSLSGMKHFAKFDFRHGFYQIPLEEDLRPYFVIVFDKKPYAFSRLPMGWNNSMAFFDTAVQMTISRIRDQLHTQGIKAVVESYADDVCIGALTKEALDGAIMLLLQTYREDGWTVSPKKVVLHATSIEFLGQNFSAQGVLPGEGTRTKLQGLPAPTSKTEVRSCLGLIRAILKFCRLQAQDLALLQDMTKWESKKIAQYFDKRPDEWKKIIKQLEQCWHCRPDLAHSHLDLYVDACREGYGFALFDRETTRLVQLGAGAFQKSQFSSSGKAELVGLVKALNTVRHLLLGCRFTIFTDATVVRQANNPLNQSVLIQKHLDTLNLAAGRIKHIDGISNTIADLLSRSPYWRGHLDHEETTQIRTVQTSQSFPAWYEQMPQYLRTSECPAEWTSQQRARIKHRSQHFRLHGDAMEYSPSGLQWVPCCRKIEDVPSWLQKAHEESGHYGCQTTLRTLQQRVFFPDSQKHVEQWVKGCPRCQMFARKDPTAQQTFSTWQKFNQGVGIDVIGPLHKDGQFKHIICAVDLCTRWTLLRAVPDATAGAILKHLEAWTGLFGYPDFLQTDNAAAFTSNTVSKWLDSKGIKRRVIPAYSPQCNGTTERMNQEVIRRLQRMCTNGKWSSHITEIQTMINQFPNSTTGISAYEATMGYRPRFHPDTTPTTPAQQVQSDPSDAAARTFSVLACRWTAIDHAHNVQDHRQSSQPHQYQAFQPGDLVLLHDSVQAKVHGNKLAPQWTGPYSITHQVSSSLYKLKHPSRSKPFLAHRNLLRRFHLRSYAQGSDCEPINRTTEVTSANLLM